jgi:site-specific DNA-methyltransferase (adenine-specific)
MEVTRIGNATLLLGDSLELLSSLGQVDHCITDPPYGEETQANARTHRNKGFNDAAHSHYIDFKIDKSAIRSAFDLIGQITKRWVIASMEFRHAALFEQCPPRNLRFVRMGCWVKANGTPQFTGDRPAMGWEAIAILHHQREQLRWNGGGLRAVWDTPVERNNGHPTPKPLGLIQDWLRLFTDEGETVLDPFMGSGTTGVACARLGCPFIGIEIRPDYFELACRRIAEAHRQAGLFAARHADPEPGYLL